MHDSEWKEILDEINAQSFNHENIIDRIKEKLLATEHQDIHRKWQRNSFDVNYSLAFQSEHTNGECTLLHLVASYGLKDLAEALLKIGARVNTTDQDNATPLHWATISGNADVVGVLLKNNADVNAKDQDRETPLHWAVKFKNQDVVRALLKKGADPSLKNEDGKTPIDLAQDNNIKQLLQRAKKRQFLKPTIISTIVGLIAVLEIIMVVLHLTQRNFHAVVTPMTITTAIIAIAVVTVGSAITYKTFAFDMDEPNVNAPSTETSEIHIEESRGIEVSAV